MPSIEFVSVLCNLAYLILLIRRSVWAWPAGISGSALSIFLFLQTHLYSEAILYSFYVIIGFYGWHKWVISPKKNGGVALKRWPMTRHLFGIFIGAVLGLAMGWYFDTKSNAARPYVDAISTSFAFVASYMEAQRIVSGWLYWIVINGFSVWLYDDRGLKLYAGLMLIYTAMSIYGYIDWRREWDRENQSGSTEPI